MHQAWLLLTYEAHGQGRMHRACQAQEEPHPTAHLDAAAAGDADESGGVAGAPGHVRQLIIAGLKGKYRLRLHSMNPVTGSTSGIQACCSMDT